MENESIFYVVMNQEEQYSIWREDLPLPDGWIKVGFKGLKDECLDEIEKLWVDMRPLSLRKILDEDEKNVDG